MASFEENIGYGNLSLVNRSWLEQQNNGGAINITAPNAVALSVPNTNALIPTTQSISPESTNPLERTPKKDTVTFLGREINKKKAAGFLAGTALLAVAAFTAIHKISRGKTPTEIPAEIQAKINDVIGNFIYKQPEFGAIGDKSEYTVNEILNNFVQDYDLTGRTLYHGTDLSSAQSIQKGGFIASWRGSLMGNFGGVYLTDKHNIAEGYALQKIKTSPCKIDMRGRPVTDTKVPVEKITPAIVEVGFADGTKLAKLCDDNGNGVFDFLVQLKKSKELTEIIKELTSGFKGVKNPEDLIEDYITNNLKNRGYIGTMQYDFHTGWTQIIFDRKEAIVKNIRTLSQN